MITVIDYGMGNCGSILNMCMHLGIPAELTGDVDKIMLAEKLILPGVGAFDKGMERLRSLGLVEPLNLKVLKQSTPMLGICLGMQLFARNSEEGNADGLGWIDAKSLRFQPAEGLRVPHMGWNTIHACRSHWALDGMESSSRFYFVHSYFVECNDPSDRLAETVYGQTFTSAVSRGTITGVQFHPEKSLRWGMTLLRNFFEQA